MVEPAERDSRGILHPEHGLRRFQLTRYPPSGELARFVDRFWFVAWQLPPGHSHAQQVLTHPVVNVVFDPPAALVSGIDRGRFTRLLTGRGRALGVMFRPGGFRPWLVRPLHTITGRSLPLPSVLPGGDELTSRVLSGLGAGLPDEKIVAEVERFLTPLVPAGPHLCERTIAWAELAARDRSVRRVDDLAQRVGVSVRTLQRRFADDVGVGAKWVIRRYRLYEVARRAAAGERLDWAGLAAELGFSDQAHLVREFTAAVGQSPSRYAARRGHEDSRRPASAGRPDGERWAKTSP